MEQASGFARSRSESGLKGNNVGSYAVSALFEWTLCTHIYI